MHYITSNPKKPLLSPTLVTGWTQLTEPKPYVPKGGTPKPGDKGKYSVKLRLNPGTPEHDNFIQTLEMEAAKLEEEILAKEGVKKIRKVEEFLPIGPELDEDGVETGVLLFRASKRAGGISKKTGKAWESKLDKITVTKERFVEEDGKSLGSGTRMRAAVVLRTYQTSGKWGISADLVCALIVEPQYFSGSVGASAFDDVDIPEEDFTAAAEANNSDGDF